MGKEEGVAAGNIGEPATPGSEYRPLDVLIGRWTTIGHVVGSDGHPAAAIATSDIYEWAPGGFFILHTAYGLIGEQGVGGVEMIGYDPAAKRFRTTLFDSQGNVIHEELSVAGTTWKWVGAEVRCTGTLEDGRRLVCHHERLDGDTWVPSMEVTLTRVD